MTLEERVREIVEFPLRKHRREGTTQEQIEDKAVATINAMSNVELVALLSEALTREGVLVG